MGVGGRRKCGEGIDNGWKRRTVLLALVRVSHYVQVRRADVNTILLDRSNLEAVSVDRPLCCRYGK